MDQTPATDPDPDIAALLGFEPVLRRCKRHDGWTPERQRGFIAALARLGSVDRAAQSVGRTTSGVWKVRESAGAEEFSDSWDGALALFHRRNPELARRGGRAAPPWAEPKPAPAPASASPPPEEVDEDADWQMLCDGLLRSYMTKLCQEREARLLGCIVEADHYVRQLGWLEVAMDLGGLGDRVVALLNGLKRGDLHAGRIVATPVSLLLDRLRREVWASFGEPERPPPPELGPSSRADASTGAPTESAAPRPSKADLALRAEAQTLWEDKARRDAAAWRERLGLPPLGAEGEGDRAEEGE